jgi:type II secretory ATPase GspE/PulE/Tfp pilus assembly ATPase PilB-like protein
LTLDKMIKYMMRQDPEVLFVGEIRDRMTAEAAMQAALTGHLLITTFHAGSAAESIGRLYEIGIEPFALRSGISCVLCQRLVRKLCPACSEKQTDGLALSIGRERYEIAEYSLPKGCGQCNGTGYAGRILLAESLPLENPGVMRAMFDRPDMQAIGDLAVQNGMIPMSTRAALLIESHASSPQEIHRVFG